MKTLLLIFTMFCINSCLYAEEPQVQRIKVSFNIIEARKITAPQTVIAEISELLKRRNSEKFRFVAGGDFCVPKNTIESFATRQNDSDMNLEMSWKTDDDNLGQIVLHYKARLSYPMQKDFLQIENRVLLSPKKPYFISESITAQGKNDTRPMWAVVSAEFVNPSFAFPRLGSIGLKLQIMSGFPFVTDVIKNSPTSLAGIEPGDEIRNIDGVSTLGMTLKETVKLIRGDPGTVLNMKILKKSSGQIETKELVRKILD